MRDAKNLQDLNLHIHQNIYKIDSVWVTEDGSLYIKVKFGNLSTNYQADKIISMLKEQNLLNLNAKIPQLRTGDI